MRRIRTDKKQPGLQADQRLKAMMNKLEGESAPQKLVDHARSLSGGNTSREDRRS